MRIQQKEMLFAGVAGLAAAAAILAMPQLVAAPKLLFGRSLSAITPSLFPTITLAIIVLIASILMLLSWRSARSPVISVTQDKEVLETDAEWKKTGIFFVLLVGYGLMLKPAGFLFSSFLVITITSVMLGNRNWLQILAFAIIAPVCLYLLATRGMLVSLPELNQIELWYARAIDWLTVRFTS